MPSLKEVSTKIVGVKKTSQITKAMNMVSSAKLRGAQEKMENFHPYAEKFNITMANLSGSASDYPLMEVREVNSVEIVVVTSDRGLCGSFNANIISNVEKMTKEYEAQGKKVSYVCVGKKGNQMLQKTGKVRKAYTDIMGSFEMFNAREIASEIADNFVNGGADDVQLIYGHFYSVASQKPVTLHLLPVKPVEAEDGQADDGKPTGDYIAEPSSEEIMEVLLPLYVNVMIYNSMLQVGASEHAARMTAMDNATNACNDIVAELTMVFNKARQAAITGDLMDIVGGAEALKG